jgi:hypothetical protein
VSGAGTAPISLIASSSNVDARRMKNAIPKLWTAEFVSRILTAVATLYVARIVGVVAYGLLGFVSAVLAYILVFVRFGTDDIIVRELSRKDLLNDVDKSQLRTTAVIARAVFSVPAIVLLVLLAFTAETGTLANFYLGSIIVVLGTLVPVDIYLQAEEKFAAMAGYRILSNVVYLALVLVFVQSIATSWVVPAATGAGLLIGEAAFFRLMRIPLALPRVAVLKRMWKYLISQGLPLFGSMLLLLFVGQVSIIFVKAFCSGEQLGWYVAVSQTVKRLAGSRSFEENIPDHQWHEHYGFDCFLVAGGGTGRREGTYPLLVWSKIHADLTLRVGLGRGAGVQEYQHAACQYSCGRRQTADTPFHYGCFCCDQCCSGIRVDSVIWCARCRRVHCGCIRV